MKRKELKALNESELKEKLDDLRKTLVKLNAQVATGTALKSPGEIKKIKRSIAQLLTLQNKKSEVAEKA